MELQAIGIDLGKTVFHLVGLDSSGNVIVRKRCSRTQLLKYTANLRVQRIGMEACSGSHFLARALREQGHDARLIPAQYVKPYVKTNKSDYIDAEAIAEAVQRPTMRFVPIKTEEQLDLQTVHRVRERWVMRRTAVVNQIRGLLLERGLTLPKGRSHVDSGTSGDPNRSRAETGGFVSRAVRSAPARTGAALGTHRTDGRGNPGNGQRERSLPTAHGHPGDRPGNRDSFGRRDRQWSRLSKREGPGRLGGNGSSRVFDRRQTEAARHQQAWKLVSAKIIRPGSTSCDAVSDQAGSRAELLVVTVDVSYPPERGSSRASEQAAPHGLGGSV